MKIINLTQHVGTQEQYAQGLVEPVEYHKKAVCDLLTFKEIPEPEYIHEVATMLAQIAYAYRATHALIGGAPYLMSALEYQLFARGITPVYAFSKRESVEVHKEDGSVEKRNVFKHAGWVIAEDSWK